jgi:RNA polymerase primary sigma factor
MPYHQDLIKSYLNDVSHIPLITPKEEKELAKRIAQGDEEARKRLIRSNLRLVVKIAYDFKGLGLSLIDLIAEGNIGLMRAVDKFDPSKGAKFSSYALWWIKQSMRRALTNQSHTIRIPIGSAGKINKIRFARERLTTQLGREPTDMEIAKELQLNERTVTALRRADVKSFSLEDTVPQGSSTSFEDLIPDLEHATPYEMVRERQSFEFLQELIERTLNSRERRILIRRFGLDGKPPNTLEELSQEISLTRERVRQLQYTALAKLKIKFEEDLADK